jgi:hypothetical protein
MACGQAEVRCTSCGLSLPWDSGPLSLFNDILHAPPLDILHAPPLESLHQLPEALPMFPTTAVQL